MNVIYIYWPRKKIPSWLENVKPKDESSKMPDIFEHGGFGVVFKRGNRYLVYGLTGSFIYISGAHSITIRGGGDGVLYYAKFSSFCRAVVCA